MIIGEKVKGAGMVRILTVLLITGALTGVAQAQEGDPAAGLAYARDICAQCHAAEENSTVSPNPKSPSFSRIANTPGMTGAALMVFLQTPHRAMPDLIVPEKEKPGLVAYILSLKR
jgi:hypothetical protein